MKKYDILYLDPPWFYDREYDFNRKHSEIPYPTMKVKELIKLPIKNIAAKNCGMFVWATFPKLKEAFEVIKAWEFRYITTAFVWVKTNSKANTLYSGLGYWTNSNAEICLFAKRGHPKRRSKTVKQVIFAPRGEHSAKPPQIKDRIVDLMGDLPRAELFARNKVKGWDSYGNEIDGRDIREVLNELCNKKVA